MIVDTHAHLSDERLRVMQAEIVGNLSADGLERVVEIGANAESSRDALALARKYPPIYCAVGTHPHDAREYCDEIERFYRAAAQDPKTVAIGEIGLDYYYDVCPREIQKDAFERQLIMADEVGLPVVLHVRDAYRDALEILTANRDRLNCGVLLHCYGGSAESVREFGKFDCYYAFGGAITFKNAKKDEIVRAVPLDRLLIETDCPYMTPVPLRGQTNQPKYINYTLDKLCEILGKDRAEVERITTRNAYAFFGKMR